MKKRLFAAVIALAMIFAIIPVSASAEQTLKKGDTVEYVFSVGKCENVAGISVDLFFSDETLELAKDPEFLIAGQDAVNTDFVGKLRWNIMINGGREFDGQDVLVAAFTVKKDCSLKDAALSFECTEIFNHDLQLLSQDLVSARVKVNGDAVKLKDPLKKGDTVEYIFTVGKCDNVAGIAVKSYYSESLLELAKDPEFVFDGQGAINTNYVGKLRWNVMINGGRAFNGEDVFVETFTVKQDCLLEDAALSYEVEELFNHGLQNLPAELITARVRVNGADIAPDTQDTDTDIASDTDPDTDTETASDTDVKPQPEPVEAGIYGDLDDDGKITANDALTILRSSIGLDTLTAKQKTAANVDGDEQITANDALAVLRNSIGLTDSNKVGSKITA